MTDDIHGSPESHGARDAEPHGDPEQQDGGGLTEDRVAQIIARELSKFAGRPLNNAITSHVKRAIKSQAPPPPSDSDDDADDSQDDEAPESRSRDSHQGPSAAEKRFEAKMRKLEKQLEEERQARQQESEARRQAERDGTLRKAIEAANVANVEAVFRFVKPDLQIDENGAYYAEVDGEFLDVRDYLASVIKANPLFQPASGKGGGSSTPPRAAPNVGAGKSMSRAAAHKAVSEGLRSGDASQLQDLIRQVGAGKLRLE